jgi:cephalosporin-C deacetylase-like acetyl esterase
MRLRIAFVACLAVASSVQAAPKVKISLDKESGIYQPGQSVTWTIELADSEKPLTGTTTYRVLKGGLTEMAGGKLELTKGKATVTATRNDPGVLLLAVIHQPEGDKNVKNLVTHAGASYAPRKIVASSPVPDDFDAFWKAKIAQLDAVPMNVKLEKIDVKDDNIEYFKITMDNINGRKIYGQIAKPAGKSQLPALLQVQYAGVYPLQRDWVIGQARKGWLAMNISAHDLPIDKPAAFYMEKAQKELSDYPGIGNDDRETSYFLPMFLSCRRAVDYLTQHPDWNKGPLVVHGTSQGGYQSIVTAGIHPAVTALASNVPAGCDHTAKAVGRAPGWPNWASRTWQKGKTEEKMLATSRYFDAMNFATRVKGPALVGLGLADTTCPPEGILATVNNLKGSKQVVIMPLATHSGDHRAYNKAFAEFLEEQKKSTSK